MGAVEKRIPVPAVAGIEELAETIVTSRDIG
jgi:hypothetical protein